MSEARQSPPQSQVPCTYLKLCPLHNKNPSPPSKSNSFLQFNSSSKWNETREFDFQIFFFFFYNLNWHFFILLKFELACHVFKIKNKPLVTSVFSIQHLMTMTILIQSWKVEDQFDTVERLWTNLTQILN